MRRCWVLVMVLLGVASLGSEGEGQVRFGRSVGRTNTLRDAGVFNGRRLFSRPNRIEQFGQCSVQTSFHWRPQFQSNGITHSNGLPISRSFTSYPSNFDATPNCSIPITSYPRYFDATSNCARPFTSYPKRFGVIPLCSRPFTNYPNRFEVMPYSLQFNPNVCGPSIVSASPASPNTVAPKATAKFHVKFDGKMPNKWIRTSYGGEGAVEIENKVISFDIGQGLTGIHWDTKTFPTDNFEFIVRARRITGEDMTCGLTFPVGNQFASLIVGGWGGSVVGISCIDDKAADENKTTSDMILKHKQWYTVRVRVSDNKLLCFVDDKKVVDVSTEGKKFSLRGDCVSSEPFAVFSFGTFVEVDRLEIIDLTTNRPEK